MENDRSWEQNTLINELVQGMEVARKLKADLRTPYSVDTRDMMVQRILSSYEKALLILRWNVSTSELQGMSQATSTLLPESPISVNGSPLRKDIDGAIKDPEEVKHDSKKRKIIPKWVDQIRVSSESGLEGPYEDGYNWRKYGQKDILGTKYPRCTFRNTQGCWATKQVQRSDEDPTIFDITYRGLHTCSQGNNAVQPTKSPDKQERPQSHNNDIHHAQASQESLAKFRNILTVSTDKLGNEEMTYPFTFPSTSFGCMPRENHSLIPLPLENDSFLSSLFQAHLLSQTTPESNYFSSPTFQMNEFDGDYKKPRSESDITEIISTNTSATNSPIPDFNISLDPVGIDPNFPFNTPGFFS
ncbi:probable WRKY transcription factor 41 isoform X2 [Gastrolobium bilobum]|uniref:probable WRKY transcription factor 41 isoform X2 n=1 Tax=Gastrolobium bilobum TaxID=150636 RepID=UPI002AB24CC6|nr:probable WRKY transcription factor 41 isoform X2 [Gastrolobium bilobum]